MTPTNGKVVAIWRWVAGVLLAVVMLMTGGFFGDMLSRFELASHRNLIGHPVMVERLENYGARFDKLDQKIDALTDKVNELTLLMAKE